MSELGKEMFRLRPYQPGDESSINQGFNEIFGQSRPIADWHWKFQPEQDGCKIMVAVDEHNQVVAQFATQCYRIQIDGRAWLAGYSVDDFCLQRPAARQQQIYLKTVREFYSRYGRPNCLPLLFGFPGERHLRLGRLLLQFGEPLLVPVWRRTAQPRRLWWRRYALRHHCAPVELDLLWRRLSPRYPATAVRDGRWLQRRYLDRPQHRYEQLTLWRGDQLRAWAVLDIAGKIARWIDLLWDGQDARALIELDDAAARLAQAAGATQLELWLSGDQRAAETLRAGGWELGTHPERLHACTVTFDPTLDGAKLLSRFYFTAGDSDLV